MTMNWDLTRSVYEDFDVTPVMSWPPFGTRLYWDVRHDTLGPVANTDWFPATPAQFWAFLRNQEKCRAWVVTGAETVLPSYLGLVWVEQLVRDPVTNLPRHGWVHAFFRQGLRSGVPRLWMKVLVEMWDAGFRQLYAAVHHEHVRCRMMLRRVGFQYVGALPGYLPFGGQWIDARVYSLDLETS